MRIAYRLSLLICGWVVSHPASAVTIVAQDRGTFARSHVIESPAYVEDIQASETRTFEAFDALDTSSSELPPLAASSSASLESSIGTQTIRAQGTATSTLVAPESDRRAETPADSFFEILFVVEEEQPYRLQGQVSAQATDAEAFAVVELVYEGISLDAEHTAGGNEVDDFDDTGTLVAGSYRLTAFALTHGEVAGDISSPTSQASFELIFQAPKPSPEEIRCAEDLESATTQDLACRFRLAARALSRRSELDDSRCTIRLARSLARANRRLAGCAGSGEVEARASANRDNVSARIEAIGAADSRQEVRTCLAPRVRSLAAHFSCGSRLIRRGGSALPGAVARDRCDRRLLKKWDRVDSRHTAQCATDVTPAAVIDANWEAITGMEPGSDFAEGDLHPSASGHARMAAALGATIVQVLEPMPNAAIPVGLLRPASLARAQRKSP